jgi:hypothetical protein
MHYMISNARIYEIRNVIFYSVMSAFTISKYFVHVRENAENVNDIALEKTAPRAFSSNWVR